MYINWREHLPYYKGDVFDFARLLGCQEDMEKIIRKIEKELSERNESISMNEKSTLTGIDKLNIMKKVSLEENIKKLEEFKNREDINYSYKSNEHEIVGTIEEFIDTNGAYSVYNVNLYGRSFCIKELETDSLHIWPDYDYDESGEHYLGAYLSFFCKCDTGESYDRNRHDLRLYSGDIVYDKNTLVLITKEYDLTFEVIERRPKPKQEIGDDEPF